MQRFILAILLSLTMVLAAAPVAAQTDIGPDDVVRFTRTLGQVAGKQGIAVWLHKAPTASGWQLRVVDRTQQKTVGVATLPEWAGADYYGYDVVVRGFGNVVVVIFEAAPAPGADAPSAAESFQVAWAYGVKRGEKRAVWQQIASTRNSPIDGGDRLVIRREQKRDQLVRLRSSEETRFCGANLAAYQVFVPEQMAFRSRLDVRTLAEGVPELKAKLPAQPFEPSPYSRFYLWYSATSDRYNADDSRTVIRPLQLGDKSTETAWVEGASGLGGGEFVTARVNDALKTRAVRIFPGNGEDEAAYEAFATPKKLLLSFSDGSRFVVEVPASPYRLTQDRNGLIVDLPRPLRTNCMTVVLLEAREGRRAPDPQDAWKTTSTALSEVSPISELHGLPPDVAALVVVEKLLKEEDRAKSRRLVQLTAPLANELVAVLQNVLRTGSEEDRVRIIPLLRSLPSDASVPILVDMFEQSQPSEKAYTLVKPAISAHGDKAAVELLRLLDEKPPQDERKYTDLTRMIGRIGGPETVAALIARFGEGSDRVRAERVRAVARGGERLLAQLFEVVREGPDTARGEDALQAITSIGRKLFYRGQGLHEGSEVLLDVVRVSQRRRVRMLALKGLGLFATEGAVEVLVTHTADPKDPLIRRQAVEALARYPDREARIALEAALLDESPDVRIAAIDGLAQRKDVRQALASIQRYAERERWKPGLEVAYTVMARLGDDNLISAMEAEIASAPSTARAAIIAEALERARRPMSAELVAKVLFSPETDLGMRRDLVDLLGLDETKQGEEILLKLIRSDSPFADLEPRQNERLRNRALLALGRRDSDSGRKELLRIVREGTSNEIRAVSLRALAFSRDVSIIPELHRVKESAPAELKDDFEQTIETVERRADIDELRGDIDEVVDEWEAQREKRAKEVKDAKDEEKQKP